MRGLLLRQVAVEIGAFAAGVRVIVPFLPQPSSPFLRDPHTLLTGIPVPLPHLLGRVRNSRHFSALNFVSAGVCTHT